MDACQFRKSFLPASLTILVVLLLVQARLIQAAPPAPATPTAKVSDSDKLDKMFELMKSFDTRLKKIEGQSKAAAVSKKTENSGKTATNTKTVKPASTTSYVPGWMVKVYENKVKKGSFALENRVGAFIMKSFPVTGTDHEKKNKITGEVGYKISGYLKVSHSGPTTFALRLFATQKHYKASCYKVNFSLEGASIIDGKSVRHGPNDAPKILTGVANLQPGNYRVDVEYTCTAGQDRNIHSFDITYLTDDMLNAKVISGDMMLRKATK